MRAQQGHDEAQAQASLHTLTGNGRVSARTEVHPAGQHVDVQELMPAQPRHTAVLFLQARAAMFPVKFAAS